MGLERQLSHREPLLLFQRVGGTIQKGFQGEVPTRLAMKVEVFCKQKGKKRGSR